MKFWKPEDVKSTTNIKIKKNFLENKKKLKKSKKKLKFSKEI